MFLNLVRQRTKNICSASNDQGENPQNPAKNPQKPRKKNAKNRKNPQILKSRCFGNFRIFLEFQKFFTVCVHGRSAEIFPETYMFGTKWIIFWVIWPIFLELPFFPRQWRVEVLSMYLFSCSFYALFLFFSTVSHLTLLCSIFSAFFSNQLLPYSISFHFVL